MLRRRPPAAPRSALPRRAAVLGACVAVMATAWCVGGWTGAASATAAAPARTTAKQTTTTVAPDDEAPSTTAAPAAPAEPASTEVGTVPTVPSTTTPALEDRANESEQATTRLNRVVIGLVLLAAAIAAATVFFWFRTRPARGAGGSDRPTRQVRSSAILIGADGSERALVDPGPAALASDDWVVRPPPTLPAEPGPSSSQVPTSDLRPSDPLPGDPPVSEPADADAADGEVARPEAAPVPAGSGGTWWASQAGEQGAAPPLPADEPAGGPLS